MVYTELDPHGKSLTQTTAELEKTFETLGLYVCAELCVHQQKVLEEEKDVDEALERLDRERCMNCPVQLLF